MADFIAPAVDWLVGLLQNMTPPDGMDAFGDVKKSWTWAPLNWPPAAAMPRTTDFDENSGDVHQVHQFTVKFGVQDADPDQLTVKAMAYMKAIDGAIAAGVWLASFRKVFVHRHDYGALFEKGGSWARFPELHLEIEARELP